MGSPGNPHSSFFVFPEYLLSFHSVDFLPLLLLLLLLLVVECSLSFRESSWVEFLGPIPKCSGGGPHWFGMLIFGWGCGVLEHNIHTWLRPMSHANGGRRGSSPEGGAGLSQAMSTSDCVVLLLSGWTFPPSTTSRY